MLGLHRRLLRQPFPSRWPSTQPPFTYGAPKGVTDSVSSVLPQDWSQWISAHRSYPAPRHTEIIRVASQCQLSVCGSTWLQLRPHLLLQHLPKHLFGHLCIDFGRSGLHQLQLAPSTETVEQPPKVNSVVERIASTWSCRLSSVPPIGSLIFRISS